MAEDKIMNINELAEYLKISKSLIRNMVANGEIPHIRIRKRILFSFSEIKEWLDTL